MNSRFESYISLMSFISKAIGPDYEISLLDTRNGRNRIIAMEYGNISGRRVGDNIPYSILKAIKEKEYENTDYIVNRATYAKTGKSLRTSMFFIKTEDGELEGIMCINFDDSRYEELGKKIMFLCHPDKYVEERLSKIDNLNKINTESIEKNNQGESMTIEESIETMIDLELKEALIPVERLTPEEKIQIVKKLDQKGFFMLKGAVNILSRVLDISQASVYRYINIARD